MHTETSEPIAWWRRSWFVLAAIVILAFNLRPAAVSPGPVLYQIQQDLQMSASVAGVLNALPALCFAGFGSLAPWLANLLGRHRAVWLALAVMTLGQVVRIFTDSTPVFLVFSLIALSGLAVGNVLIPSLVKEHFPERVGLVTAVYSTCLTIGLTLASVLTTPLADSLGGWRQAFWAWILLASVGLVLWLAMLGFDRGHHPSLTQRSLSMRHMASIPLPWLLGIFFGFQAGLAYAVFGWLPSIFIAAGVTPALAGLYLGIATGVGIPLAFLLPAYTARHAPYPALIVISACGIIANLGLLLAPTAAPVLWSLLTAVGTASFPVFLALMGLRARTADGTASLAGFSQTLGYLIATPFPLLVGVLRDLTGDFTWSLVMLAGMMVPLCIFSCLAARPDYVEDQLARRGRIS